MLSESKDTGPTHKPPSDTQHRSRHRVKHDTSVEVSDRQSKGTSDGLRSMHYYQNWANSIFLPQKEIEHVDNLTAAFSNGKFIVSLTQLLIGEKISGAKNDPAFLKQRLDNTQKCLELLAAKGIEMEDVSSEDLVNGKRVAIKRFCKTLQNEHKKGSISASKSLDLSLVGKNTSRSISVNPTPYAKPQQKISKSLSANFITSESEKIESGETRDLSLEEIRIEAKSDSDPPSKVEKSANAKIALESIDGPETKLAESEKGKIAKKTSLEIPPHRISNKFLPSTPSKTLGMGNLDEGPSDAKVSSQANKDFEDEKNKQISEQKAEMKRDEEDTKILRSKSKSSKDETGSKHLQSKHKRYSPLDITRLAGRLFDAFNTSTSEEPLSEEPSEEIITENNPSEPPLPANELTTESNPPILETAPVQNTTVKESLTVLPALAIHDLTPGAGETVVEKTTKRILRKNKRQTTVIESQEVLQARVQKEAVTQEGEISHLDSNTPEEVHTPSTQDSPGSERMDETPELLKQRKREKSSTKINHRFKSALSQQSNLTEAHSMEDVWQELQRMKATVRTHHSLANRFAQDYPVMRRCFETQSQSVRKLERIQHTRSRNVENELQDKLALMEGYLVQTMRENADLRSKVWGLTSRLTQLEKAGGSSRPSSILSFSDIHRRDHLGIQDISKHKRTLKLKKFFGEEPPPLLEEIPTSFTHDASKEDDEIV